MNALIFRTRLEVLCSNLERVKLVLDMARKRGDQIGELSVKLFGHKGAKKLAAEAKKRLDLAKVHLEGLEGVDEVTFEIKEAVDETTGEIKKALEAIHGLTNKLKYAEGSLSRILKHRVEIAESKEKTFQDRVIGKAEEGITSLQDVLGSLDGEDGGAAERDMAAAWSRYREALEKQSEPLFAEYVDLLRGLALRECGLEDGICQLADQLLAGFDRVGRFSWESLAIPAHGTSTSTRARTIRLGFPEWTLWALPLSAFELGRVVVREQKQLTEYVNQQMVEFGKEDAGIRQSVEESLAEAFAVYTAGPAYACAALLMRLDPSPIGQEAGELATDGERAQMVLEGLKQAAEESKSAPFDSIREELEAAWTEAIQQTGARPVNQEEADRCTQRMEFFWDWKSRLLASYSGKSLVRVAKWASLLLNEPDEIEVQGKEISDVLNTAWLCRLGNPEKSEEIHAAALELWDRMRRSPTKGRGGGAQFGSLVAPTRQPQEVTGS